MGTRGAVGAHAAGRPARGGPRVGSGGRTDTVLSRRAQGAWAPARSPRRGAAGVGAASPGGSEKFLRPAAACVGPEGRGWGRGAGSPWGCPLVAFLRGPRLGLMPTERRIFGKLEAARGEGAVSVSAPGVAV